METESEFELTEGDSTVVLDEVKLHQIVAEDSLHFDEWTSLISEIENTCPDNIERICLVYDSFLSVFPLCYGYWRRYVHHKMRLCTVEEVVEVFERSVLSATYCVDMWVDYCNFGRLVFEDQSDVRRLFKRAISFVGKNYLCHTLWDKYIEFEFSLKHWSSLAHIYIQALRSPTKKLHRYYENFKKLVEIWEGGMKSHSNSTVTVAAEPILNDETSICYNQDALSCIIKDLLDPFRSGLDKLKALHKYRSLGEGLFQDAVQLYEKVDFFETRIKRSYFHVKPLDVSQLQNWHDYLDFAESHGDFNWALQLYERCLIPCANCPEFWMRYVEFLERKGGREIANFALDRATQIHLKRLSVIHLFNARFKEHIGDVFNARAAFLKCSTTSDKDFVENVVMRANMENRLGNSIAASTIYKDALETATAEEKWHILPVLYIHFSRLKLNINDCEDAAIDILIDGIKHVPSCKLLIEELVKFAIMHRGSRHINVIDSIVANAISPQPGGSQGLSLEDGEEISRLYLEFVDLCGTVSDVRKAWNRHIRLFPLSVRDTLFYPAKEARKWKLVMETREETLPRLPNQPPGDCNSDCLAQSPLQVDKLPSSENNDTHQAADPVTDEVLEKKSPVLANHDMQSTQLSNQESALVENLNELSEKEKTDALQSGESDNNSHEDVHQMAYKDSDTMGENIIEPKLSPDLEHQIVNETENTPAALQFNKENDVQTEYNHKLEQDLKLPSLETLSLDTQDANAAPRSPPPHDSEALEETSLSDGSLLKSEAPQKNSISDENILECGQNVNVDHVISSPLSPRATVSTRSNFGNDCPSSLASTQNITGKAFPRPQKQASGKNWHQRNISNKFGRDSKHGFHGHLHKRQHKRQSSPQRTRQRSPMPVNEDYRSHRRSSQNPHRQGGQVQSLYPPSNVHTNESQDWLMHSSQQNLSAACQSQQPTQPAVYPQPQIPQYSLQSNEPQQNLQNNQAYNETWQYYYYQQQLQLFWQQQQLLQHQQPEQQQQQLLQHQYQQQLLQMQYFQQQQQQGQQQQISYQQQQLQQLQQQQQEGQLQQQPYQLQQQQHLLYLQQQQQLQLQPQHQQSQLQLQLQQQQSYHQQQTASSQQDPHGQEQRQSKQQMDTSQIQDGVTPSRNAGEPEINESSASPHPVSSKSMA